MYYAHSKVDGLARIRLTLAMPVLQGHGHSSTTPERRAHTKSIVRSFTRFFPQTSGLLYTAF